MAVAQLCMLLAASAAVATADRHMLLSIAGAPGPAAAALSVGPASNATASNMVATVIANSVNFTGNLSVVLSGIAPVITYFADTPEWRAGTWNLSQFTSPKLAAAGLWLGGPDATLIGTDKNGTKVAVLLGTLTDPLFDNKTGTLTLNATALTTADKLGLVGGISSYVQKGKGSIKLATVTPQSLENVALILDLAVGHSASVAETKSAVAAFRFGGGSEE
eukprot:jgi/Botrbrau1/11776/Bobra.0195s0100.2